MRKVLLAITLAVGTLLSGGAINAQDKPASREALINSSHEIYCAPAMAMFHSDDEQTMTNTARVLRSMFIALVGRGPTNYEAVNMTVYCRDHGDATLYEAMIYAVK